MTYCIFTIFLYIFCVCGMDVATNAFHCGNLHHIMTFKLKIETLIILITVCLTYINPSSFDISLSLSLFLFTVIQHG